MKPMLFEPRFTRQEEGGAVDDHSQAMRAASGLQSHLELSLGISSDTIFNVATGRVGEKRHRGGSGELPAAFPVPIGDLALHRSDEASLVEAMKRWSAADIHSGFVHPWSLAARQQKAVLEQAHRSPSLTRAAHPVGWPPVRASRKNIASANLVRAAEMDGEKDAKRPKLGEGEAAKSEIRSRSTMFVKVNMEGYVFGRKIDLKAHDGYQSLSRALCKLFRNFLSSNCLGNSEEQDDEAVDDGFILLYEDNEGDQMLAGDIPWELFITSVKKLYIAPSPKRNDTGGEPKKPTSSNN
ncbi:unnamed protein product [Musa acuminata subsp. malaccensis]|uniref:Auxin-responsive protein n=1 Tax=Musa acuminata subsp. malaccensis TaxID=214687 RepID=A0A804JMA4_MUSAM|nr:PREDICTED: auxin-responsive protein IAA25-like isoform X1 [Musa acuminata subsp. malaccensis]CAG1847908.1 unnamed protein product [Musa acuminata subsp. malaccensis]